MTSIVPDTPNWVARSAALLPTAQLVINGATRPSRSGETFPTTAPRTGRVVAEVAASGPVDVNDAVASARRAFDLGSWSRSDPRHRQQVLQRLSDLMLDNLDELALLESLDAGHPIGDALRVDVPNAARTFRWYAEALDKVSGEVAPAPRSALATVTREPLGVIGAVTPWNYPLIIEAWKLAPALAAGNSVVLKPAEQTSLTAIRLAELALEAGLPPGVLNVVTGHGEIAGQALGRHPDVDKITFTGSPAVGRLFQRYAGESNGKQVALELGGKSPQLVLADAPDLAAAASAIAWGIFYNAGQTCHAGSRLLVDTRVHDELLDHIGTVTAGLRLGDPLDPASQIGPIIDDAQTATVLSYLDVAAEEGAQVWRGGGRLDLDGECAGGNYLEPTVLDGVRNSSRIGQEEIFGPVLATVTFDGVAEGVRLANESRYGLAASVWTADLATAHQVSRALHAGTVWVNTYDMSDMITPFGGVKDSGFGRDRSLHALDAYTSLKTTWIDLGPDIFTPSA